MAIIHENPVWSGELADPFVLKHKGEYWGYGTSGIQNSSHGSKRIFPVLHSTDFIHWNPAGYALDTSGLNAQAGAFWAPEVAERDGKFYMYFSFSGGGSDEFQRLHAAISDHPAGPFRIAGPLIPEEGFTIDAHPFRDPVDGKWYLFFAKDFFDDRVGTGLAAALLDDSMARLKSPPKPILRPFADWQIYERNRFHYNRRWEAWHTIEGGFVVYHKKHYWCFYSGGPWTSPNYGVGCAVADHVLGPYEDPWSREGPSILRTIPDIMIGPGHNSVVTGPDDKTHYIVYHSWDKAHTARRMFISPLVWTANGPRLDSIE
ncbi:glycoside hydrolase family 43 protein [Candidatus Sumerlaeota bacterium]|nr:glycoside hydrolase family 43 protein [Candidatus Sumerlaeota bacterium]